MDNLEFIIEDIEDIDFGLDVGIQEIYPELEDLEVTPSSEEQVFTHENSYGYDKVIVKPIVVNKYAPRYISFYRYSGSELDEELKNLDTSNITDMTYMFGVAKVVNLDLSHFNTSKVTIMANMFNGCTLLKSVNLTNFDTSNVTTMSSMFADCQVLKSLDISHFDTSKVTSFANMFRTAATLTSLDLSNWNTINTTAMNAMFQSCSKLMYLDIRNFTFDKVTSYSQMFQSVPVNCEIIVKGETEKQWVLARRNDFTNVKTVAELEAA